MAVIFIMSFIGLSINAEAQSRKKIDSLQIIEKAFYDIDYLDSYGKEVLVKIERFDQRGELIEEIEYEDNGKIKKHIQYQYRGELLIRENSLDNKGKIKSCIEYEYDADGLKIGRKNYDPKGRITKERIYRYKKQKI
jgi:hypothetical protein